MRTIAVRDTDGVDLTLYVFEDRRFFTRTRRMKLDTGELVEERSGLLVVVNTGETLTRV